MALAVVVSAGVAAAAMSRGGVIESRGVTGEPAREFSNRRLVPREPPRCRAPGLDSIAASVRDSVALLLVGEPPPPPQHPPSRSPEVNVPARGGRGDPLAHQIKQMLPDSNTRQAEPEPLPPLNMNKVGAAAEASAAYARASIDSATRKDVKPAFNSRRP